MFANVHVPIKNIACTMKQTTLFLRKGEDPGNKVVKKRGDICMQLKANKSIAVFRKVLSIMLWNMINDCR